RLYAVRRIDQPLARIERQRQQGDNIGGNALIERWDFGQRGRGRHPTLRRQQLDACRPAGGFDAPQLHAGWTPSSLALIVVTDFRLSELENTYDVLNGSA